jgi:hypothetical protein
MSTILYKKLFFLTLCLAVLGLAVAETSVASENKKNKPKINKNLGTDFNFSDLTIKGKYQYADEAAAIVENEKDLDDLLQPRKHFKDRLSQSSSRQ